ncbi:hypothetical protein [Nocardia mexicana]|uniref:hypothetical protein n=1 Tax=Nocardia mexicana TaxID=279262 RepID=UPI00403A3CBB
MRAYAENVASTHESATGAVQDMGSVYSGNSYEQLVAAWARMSTGNMAQLDQACRTVARVLDIAAEVINAVKVAVLASLAALAASYASMMAATMATGGASAALTLAVRAAANRLLDAMQDMLLGYIATEVIDKAIEPLEDAVERMMNGAAYHNPADELRAPPSSQQQLHIDPDAVLRYADLLDKYADDMLDHSTRFAENVAALEFSRPGGDGEPSATDPGGQPPPHSSTPGDDGRSRGGATTPGEVPAKAPAPRVSPGGLGDGGASPDRPVADRSMATAPTSDAPGKSDRPNAPSENHPAAAQSGGRPGTGDPVADRAAASPAPMTAASVTSPEGESAAERGGSNGQQAPVGSSIGSESLAQQGNPASNMPVTSAPQGSGPLSEANSQSPGQQQDAPRGQNAPRGQGTAQPSRGQSQPSTPWQRTGRTSGPKQERRGPTRRATAPAAKHKTGATPWSKGTRPAAEETAEPKVFAPESAEHKRGAAEPSGPKVIAPDTGVPKVIAPDTGGPRVVAPETVERKTVAPKSDEPKGNTSDAGETEAQTPEPVEQVPPLGTADHAAPGDSGQQRRDVSSPTARP